MKIGNAELWMIMVPFGAIVLRLICILISIYNNELIVNRTIYKAWDELGDIQENHGVYPVWQQVVVLGIHALSFLLVSLLSFYFSSLTKDEADEKKYMLKVLWVAMISLFAFFIVEPVVKSKTGETFIDAQKLSETSSLWLAFSLFKPILPAIHLFLFALIDAEQMILRFSRY